jgi:hypothetical protein
MTTPLSSSISKKLPPSRREIPATLVFSCMDSLDYANKPCQKPEVQDRCDGCHNKVENKCRQSRSSQSHTKDSKSDCDSVTRRTCSQQQCDLSGDEDAKDIISSTTHQAHQTCTSTCSRSENGEKLVDFYLKIPSQTSIQHRTRSDLRERYQIHGRTRRLGIVQNLLTTSSSTSWSSRKSKSLPGGRLLRGRSDESPITFDDSFASCLSV